jgi:NADPH:quinone reductase-like Zn-dependent oxidoreductase
LWGDGTWQRFVDVDPKWLIIPPPEIDPLLAARAYVNPLAVHLMLQQWPVAGRRILLTGGGSTCANLLAHGASRHVLQ